MMVAIWVGAFDIVHGPGTCMDPGSSAKKRWLLHVDVVERHEMDHGVLGSVDTAAAERALIRTGSQLALPLPSGLRTPSPEP